MQKQKQQQQQKRFWRYDYGGEYTSMELSQYLISKGTIH